MHHGQAASSHQIPSVVGWWRVGSGGIKCFQFVKQTWHFNQESQKDEVMFATADETWKSSLLKKSLVHGESFFLFFFFWLRVACYRKQQQGRAPPPDSQVTGDGGGGVGWWDPKALEADESVRTSRWWEGGGASSLWTNWRQRLQQDENPTVPLLRP